MASLVDIAASLRPAKQVVTVGGGELEIRGLSAGEIADICARFPEFGDFINESRDATAGEVRDKDGNLDADATARVAQKIDAGRALTLGGGAWPAVIAASVGQPGDEATETIARSFSIPNQQVIVMTVMALSFPDEKRPLAEGAPAPLAT